MQLRCERACTIVFSLCLLILTSLSANFQVVDADGKTISTSTSNSAPRFLDRRSPIFSVRKHISDGGAESVATDGHGVWKLTERQERWEELVDKSSEFTASKLYADVHNVSERVFQFRHVDLEQNWPDLKLGWRMITSIVWGGLGAALSSSGGLGGGGLFVPLFNLLLQFDAKTSAALSNFMILGGSMANLNLNLRERHPLVKSKPLIDFDLVLLLQPNMLLGISAGVILNVVLADWIITAVLTLTLTIMTVHSFKSAIRRWDKETIQNSEHVAKAANDGIEYDCGTTENGYGGSYGPSRDDEITPCGQVSGGEQCGGANGFANGNPELDGEDGPKSEGAEGDTLSQPLLGTKDGPTLPMEEVRDLALTWLAFFAVQVLRQGLPILPIKTCGLAYWLLTLTQVPLAWLITTWTIKRLRASHHSKQDPESIQDVCFVLKPESCRRFAWMGLVAGVSGGLLGIGGGMIVNPMLLAVGMMPQVTAATCALMVFFSSSMSVVQFWLMGRVPITYALIFMVVSAVFSFLGVSLVQRAIVKYNRASLIVFSVATVMGMSAVLMGLFGGWETWESYLSGGYMGFHNPC